MKKPRGLLLLLASDENNHSGMFACLWIALYTVISIQKEKGFQSTLRDKSCTLKPWY